MLTEIFKRINYSIEDFLENDKGAFSSVYKTTLNDPYYGKYEKLTYKMKSGTEVELTIYHKDNLLRYLIFNGREESEMGISFCRSEKNGILENSMIVDKEGMNKRYSIFTDNKSGKILKEEYFDCKGLQIYKDASKKKINQLTICHDNSKPELLVHYNDSTHDLVYGEEMFPYLDAIENTYHDIEMEISDFLSAPKKFEKE